MFLLHSSRQQFHNLISTTASIKNPSSIKDPASSSSIYQTITTQFPCLLTLTLLTAASTHNSEESADSPPSSSSQSSFTIHNVQCTMHNARLPNFKSASKLKPVKPTHRRSRPWHQLRRNGRNGREIQQTPPKGPARAQQLGALSRPAARPRQGEVRMEWRR